MPLDTGDEARRALVSLEMMLYGDYLTPTLHGERYFNKPPLYNWLIIGLYHLFGNQSTFALRFPMLLSLLGLGAAVFAFVRRYVNAPVAVAVAAALMLLTNGRVLFYDATLGLIEITFALVTYLTMMLVFHFDRQRSYWLLYTTTYLLTAIGFLLKGCRPSCFRCSRCWAGMLYPALAAVAAPGPRAGHWPVSAGNGQLLRGLLQPQRHPVSGCGRRDPDRKHQANRPAPGAVGYAAAPGHVPV